MSSNWYGPEQGGKWQGRDHDTLPAGMATEGVDPSSDEIEAESLARHENTTAARAIALLVGAERLVNRLVEEAQLWEQLGTDPSTNITIDNDTPDDTARHIAGYNVGRQIIYRMHAKRVLELLAEYEESTR